MATIDRDLLDYLEDRITPERKERFLEILASRTRFLTVALEDVFQMHNASAVIRSCDAFGIQEAHLIEGRFGQRLDKNIAMGAQQWVDIQRHKTSLDCIGELRAKGYRIIATVPSENAIPLQDFLLETPTALFFGTEKEGLSPEVLKQADAAVYIPMFGFTESLNVSVAAAILLQRLREQLNASSLDWRLSENEMLEKRMDWTCKSIHSAPQIINRYYTEKSGTRKI
ncbi:TrmH family RNA methyltransferase [Robiginitalea aurantiaca]|uniref:tRNA (guanosine(18)-2'-O)-methyltransferase n=1 Tax=Robiginitalea aurantiaca TaxID=3056915 RepID=A0ABT7WC97_9FLAO|nr:RNA methyltransferase [Robiginitalea aurantiaca]MDM9630550.1 RNA methyltransferase [Robiginitalea aurantiaca]